MKIIQSNMLGIFTLFFLFAISAILYTDLPQELTTEFNWDGTVIGTSPKQQAALLLPLVYMGLIVLVNILISISPQKFSMPNSKRAMDIILFGIGILFCFLHYGILANAGNFGFFVSNLSYGIALFLIVVGNVFGKTERNFFIGIRLPWTIASTDNWKATHRFAGKLMFAMGAVLLVSNTLYSNLVATIVFSGITVILPALYSMLYFFKYERRNQVNESE